MDIFVEQIVKKRRNGLDGILIAGIIFLTVVVCLFALLILPKLLPILSFLNLIVVVGAIFLAYILISNFNIEYEYAITNGDITIDKIMAKKRRKRIESFDCKNCTEIGKYKICEHEQKAYSKILDVSICSKEDETWYMVINNELLLFSPDERVLQSIQRFLRPSIAQKTFGKVIR